VIEYFKQEGDLYNLIPKEFNYIDNELNISKYAGGSMHLGHRKYLDQNGKDGDFVIKELPYTELVNAYIGSRIAEEILGESSSKTRLAVDVSEGKVLGYSEKIQSFKPLSYYNVAHYGALMNKTLSSSFSENAARIYPDGPVLKNFADVSLTDFFICHGDSHSDNVGTTATEDNLILIDYDASLSTTTCLEPKMNNNKDYIRAANKIISLNLDDIHKEVLHYLSQFPIDTEYFENEILRTFEGLHERQAYLSEQLDSLQETSLSGLYGYNMFPNIENIA